MHFIFIFGIYLFDNMDAAKVLSYPQTDSSSFLGMSLLQVFDRRYYLVRTQGLCAAVILLGKPIAWDEQMKESITVRTSHWCFFIWILILKVP